MNRRKFLKYAVATGSVVGASALGLDYVVSSRSSPMNQPTTSLSQPTALSQVTSTSKTNHAPVIVDYETSPRFIWPTSSQEVKRAIEFYDADNDPLTAAWLVDGKEMGNGDNSTVQLADGRIATRSEYVTNLREGQHTIEATVSDGINIVRTADWYGQPMTVEPDQMYEPKSLGLKYKGVSYFAAPIPPDWSGLPQPDNDTMNEQLDTIRNELGCNAVIVTGGESYEDRLIECARMAMEKGFERVHVQLRCMGATADETVKKIRNLAPKVKSLREAYGKNVIYCVGHEFGLETAIVPGDTWLERLANLKRNIGWDNIHATLPKMFSDIIAACNENYGYPISYAAIADREVDLVPWGHPFFESVGVDAYIQPGIGWTVDWVLNKLAGLKSIGKPIESMEAGCYTIRGAGQIAGQAPIQTNPYDEEEQANYIKRYCEMLNRARIQGYFYTQYNDNWDKGYGLYNRLKRKKGFYMYKSYQRTM